MTDQLQCDQRLLQQIISGSLAEQTENRIQQHLEHCDSCQQQLQSLAAEQSDWQKLSDYFLAEDEATVPYDGQPTVDIQLDPSASAYVVLESSTATGDDHQFLDPASHPELLGQLDGFAVERVIGRGGMGLVYRAFDTELNRPVAIKVLAEHLAANGVARKRFAREARAAAAVMHPNVVPIHGVNSTAKRPYIVMTLVPGRSLQSHISDDGPLTVKEVVRISKQIASGLAAAHEQGLVHRDIKPANILLEQDVSRVMITDFGLARAADDAAITQTGWLAGTPHYMSPEQASGMEVDHRSDLFSLGSVMYFMATGREPFRAEKPVAVLKKISADPPDPARSINSDVSKTLSRIIERLMAKDPTQRFQSAAEVDRVLTQYLAHLEQPGKQRKPKIATVRKWTGLRVTLCSLIAVMLLVLSGWRYFNPPAKPARKVTLPQGLWTPPQLQLELDLVKQEIEKLEHPQPASRSARNHRDLFDSEFDSLRDSINRLEHLLRQTP